MKAAVLTHCAPIETHPLTIQDVEKPTPKQGEILVKVSVCGVCRTDLHVVEGELPHTHLPLIPGHQVVGQIVAVGPECHVRRVGERVGIAWLHKTCQECQFCLQGSENLCDASVYTGYHVNGGYAEYATVPEEYAYVIPEGFSDAEAAPLLCAGIIGYRAFKRAQVPSKGRLGLIGFGSSAHITMQVALAQGCEVYVISRDAKHRQLAQSLGASWTGSGETSFPEPMDSVIVFAPAGNLIPLALRSLKKGGTVALAGITMSDVPSMDYDSCLFHEKNLRSVEANTRQDGEELLALAAKIPIKPHVTLYPLEQANEVLCLLKQDAVQGTAVLEINTLPQRHGEGRTH